MGELCLMLKLTLEGFASNRAIPSSLRKTCIFAARIFGRKKVTEVKIGPAPQGLLITDLQNVPSISTSVCVKLSGLG